MAVIAVAGGTGNVGRTLVEAIIATGKHDVKILARKANAEVEKATGASILVVDYADVAATARALEQNNVHTVISAINTLALPGAPEPQEIELIKAADASKTTRRFITSGWGIPHNESQINDLASVPHKLRAQAFVKNETGLEHTVIHNGFFLDYWGPRAEKSHMTPLALFVDIPGHAAAIPGTGDVPAVFTHTRDVARFVAAALDLDEWEPEFYVVGDKLTLNELLGIAESAKGAKFNVAYDSVEKLRASEPTELPSQVAAYPFFPKQAYQAFAATFGLWFAGGVFDIPPAGTKTLNDVFPDIKTWKAKDLLEKSWKA
ncbi:Oxidoreductase BOA1 [Colletotrichum sidae]|uniref:Oxidoreductase BOA1 n=1 Tax=Colletotrichum sidae TaxID=1347389 RepID=A0A4R8TPM4_9PEZI|nr:Oxidoreductase BOA1 [Colletotrichum sidae]